MSGIHWEDHFRDTGCEFSPMCQTCPLPMCKHDMAAAEVNRLRHRRRRAVLADRYQSLRKAHPDLTVNKVVALAATEAGVSERTIARALAEVGGVT